MLGLRTNTLLVVMLAGLGLAACNEVDPGNSAEHPLIRWDNEEGEPSGAERGNVMINEINFAGSVKDDGTYDPDDIFIEILNKQPRAINLSGWRLNISGDYEESFRIPTHEKNIKPNDYLVIAKKRDGAFADIADIFMEDLQLGKRAVYVDLRDFDNRLMESGGHKTLPVFSGGYDLVTTRSMERVQILFGNRGAQSRAWHAYSDDTGFPTISEGYRKYTLASPGAANSADYSGSTTSGTFE